MRVTRFIVASTVAALIAATIVTVPEYSSGTLSQVIAAPDDDDDDEEVVVAAVSPLPEPQIVESHYVTPRMQYAGPTWLDFNTPIGQMVKTEPIEARYTEPISHHREPRSHTRSQVPRGHVRSAPQVVAQKSTWHCRLPGMALNHIGGYIPTNLYGGMIVGAATGVMGTAISASMCEGREAGHGEAYAAIIVGALPIPIPYSWAEAIAERMLKNTDLCAPNIVATHYGGDIGVVPRSLLQKAYVQKYCNGPALSREERALLKEAGR